MFHILVVDDDKHTRLLMRALLEAERYTVTLAENGVQALEMLEKHHIDLVVLDVMMPQMDGYEFTRELRAAQNDLPILMVSAKQLPEDRRQGFLAGTDDFMVKPVDEEELLLRIKALLRRARIASERRIVLGNVILDYDAMSVKSYNMLGSRASHGCVRLLVSDARWIYENIGKGVVVTITEDLPSDEELRKSVAKPALNSSKTGPVSTPEPTPEPAYLSDGMPPQPFRKLKKGSTGEDVYWLQMKLKELGYYTGAVTGGYYSGTYDAVKAYQKDNDLAGGGEATVGTLEHLYADVLSANTPNPEPTPEATPKPEE